MNVGSRQGSDKQEARGMFKGAKVIRGADWEWKNQDGGARLEGEVTDVASWDDDESAKNAVRVNWKEGQRSNIYRLGKDGKVLLIFFLLNLMVFECRARVNLMIDKFLVEGRS